MAECAYHHCTNDAGPHKYCSSACRSNAAGCKQVPSNCVRCGAGFSTSADYKRQLVKRWGAVLCRSCRQAKLNKRQEDNHWREIRQMEMRDPYVQGLEALPPDCPRNSILVCPFQ